MDYLIIFIDTVSDFLSSFIIALRNGRFNVIPNAIVYFVKAIIFAFMNWCNFSGRASRSEYWCFWIFTIITGTLSDFFIDHLKTAKIPHISPANPHQLLVEETLGLGTLAIIILGTIFYMVTMISLSVRRIHDTDNDADAVFLNNMRPFSYTYEILLLTKGTKGPNRFGDDPLAYEDY